SAAQLALFEEPAEDNDVVEQDIIPKTFRQPRKQVLEEDHDSTVKLIEQEDFKLPQTKPSDGSSSKKFENPETCCFCSEPNDRVNMIRVPRSEDRIARWLHALGQEFQSRLKPIVENYICRSHFSENAFSSRGRLLKGMLPHVQPEKVEVTYKIQGSSFLKLDEQKSGTDKNARLNLDNRKRKRMVSESDDNDDEQDEQEIEESCKVEEESDNEYEYAEIEREEGDNTSPSQEPDSASQEPESRVNVESKHEDSRESSSAKSDSIPSKKAKVVKAPTRISARLSKK
uniref:THAP-type domain-containing protein n=1 Tax=Caenorhabditis japonica TaxID=281687 RepID=A0A8R1DQX9_CAEJA